MILELFHKWSARLLRAEKNELAAIFHPHTEQSKTGSVLLGVGSDLSLVVSVYAPKSFTYHDTPLSK